MNPLKYDAAAVANSMAEHRADKGNAEAQRRKNRDAFPGLYAAMARHEAEEGASYQRDIERLAENDE